MKLNELVGLVPENVGRRLAELAALIHPGNVIVEIGSFKGKSTCYLASGSQESVPVYAIDPWDSEGNVTGRFGFAEPSTREKFNEQVKAMGFEEKITPIQGFSKEVAEDWSETRKIGLLFVDGDHHERSVLEDVEAWEPYLSHDAMIVLDDLDTPKNPGVKRAADKLVERFGSYSVEAERLAVFGLWK